MADRGKIGRGKARGRGSEQSQQQQQQQQQQRGRPGGAPSSGAPPGGLPYPQQAQARHAPAAAPPTSAWGPRPQMRQQHQVRAPAPQVQAQSGGRATVRESGDCGAPGPEQTYTTEVTGGGEVGSMHSGRGNVRGRRQLTQVLLRTKPSTVTSKLGTHGVPINLMANYFRLKQRTDWCLYRYRVDFSPEEDRINKKKALLHRALGKTFAGFIFDGTVMFSSQKLSTENVELFSKFEDSDTNYKITIKLTGDVSKGDYVYLQFYNLILRKCLHGLELQLIGRNYFDPKAKTVIKEHKLELWPGYVTSIRQHENDVLLCCEITTKVMRLDSVLMFLQDCLAQDRGNYKKTFMEGIIGSIVLTEYNNKTYRIDDVDFSLTPDSTFPKKDGTSVSYIQYYKERYAINIHNRDQPMLISRAKAREIRAGMAETVSLVPELCRLTGLTERQRSNFSLMRSLADNTRVSPGPRIEKLKNFCQRLVKNPKTMDELKQWDVAFAENLIEFKGRVLPPEDIIIGGSHKISAGKEADWTRDLRSRPMLHSPALEDWVVVCPERNKDSAYSFIQLLLKVANGFHWSLKMPKLHKIRDDRVATYIEALENIAANSDPRLIMCVVSNNNAERYSSIKKKCCVDRAIPTQVILAKNLDSKGAMSIATKVAVQINCKIGGAPWSIAIPFKASMFVGYDVCHDALHKGQSFGAMVSSMDTQCSRYFSVVTPHTNDEELSKDISLNLIKSCHQFNKVTGSFPDKIFFFRDAVGDGQLEYVYNYELKQIINTLKQSIYKDMPLKICFIIVSKRINTRFFGPNASNPPPGTVVDDCVTLPERYDFFIVSQCVRQGTVSPTSYHVMENTTGNTPDHIQRLSYKMTHMYYNWSGTVRVPAPCQYAHKLAFLTAQSLHREPKAELSTVLYYL